MNSAVVAGFTEPGGLKIHSLSGLPGGDSSACLRHAAAFVVRRAAPASTTSFSKPMNKTTISHKLGITLLAVLALIGSPASAHANVTAYTVTDLGTLGTNSTFGGGINNTGQVVGFGDPLGFGVGVVWTGATPVQLANLGNYESYGKSINASGQVAGWSDVGYVTFSSYHAVRWNGTTPTDLGTLGANYSNSYGFGINNLGQVAGISQLTGTIAFHAVRWTGTTPQDLGTLGGASSYAFGINDGGQVAGFSEDTLGIYHAVRWSGLTPEVLPGGLSSKAYGINNLGQVVGHYETAQPGYFSSPHAAVWTGLTRLDLGTLGGTISYGHSINNFGDVVGVSTLAGDGTQRLFLYTGGTMYDVNDLLPPDSGVTGLGVRGFGTSYYNLPGTGWNSSINDSGQIATTGMINGAVHALRLDPVVPEPSSTLLLLGPGLGLLLRYRRARA